MLGLTYMVSRFTRRWLNKYNATISSMCWASYGFSHFEHTLCIMHVSFWCNRQSALGLLVRMRCCAYEFSVYRNQPRWPHAMLNKIGSCLRMEWLFRSKQLSGLPVCSSLFQFVYLVKWQKGHLPTSQHGTRHMSEQRRQQLAPGLLTLTSAISPCPSSDGLTWLCDKCSLI